MSTIKELCEAIAAERDRLNLSLTPYLYPGLAEKEVKALTSDLPFRLPKAVFEMYSWRNGTQEGKIPFGKMWLFPIWYLASVERAVSRYHGVVDALADFWEPRYFPLFLSGAGDYMGIACTKTKTDDGEIVCYRQGDTEVAVEYANLNALLETVLGSYQAGAITVNNDGNLMVDDSRFEKIARKFNAGVKRWDRSRS